MKTFLMFVLFACGASAQKSIPFCDQAGACTKPEGCHCRERVLPQFVPAIQLPNAKDDDAICVDFFKDDPEKTRRCHKAFEQWSCADKRRVLLTSEDSTIHVCMKVQP